MALKDLKSNLAKGAGKPKGSPINNIPEESAFDKFSSDKLGVYRKGLIDSKTPNVPKYREFTANGEKA